MSGERVEHLVHHIRGTVLEFLESGKMAQVMWDDDPVKHNWFAQDYLDAHRSAEPGEPGPCYSAINVKYLRFLSAVDQLGDLAAGIWPTEEDIGRGVVYTPAHGGPSEDGVITGFNDLFVFVRYRKQHPSANGQATPREHLVWLSGGNRGSA
jgi:hypothetical protein